VLPFGGRSPTLNHVNRHELVHAFQFDITTRPVVAGTMAPSAAALVSSRNGRYCRSPCGPEHRDVRCARGAQGKLPSIDDLNNPKYFPYLGSAFWAYVAAGTATA